MKTAETLGLLKEIARLPWRAIEESEFNAYAGADSDALVADEPRPSLTDLLDRQFGARAACGWVCVLSGRRFEAIGVDSEGDPLVVSFELNPQLSGGDVTYEF